MGAADTEIDYPAVMGSRERLWSIYGDAWGWPPAHMTPEQDRDDLAHHEREIAAHESFLYGLFEDDEAELLGCVYIDPPEKAGDVGAEVSWWVVDRLVGSDVERALDASVPRWLRRLADVAVRATSAATSPGRSGTRCPGATDSRRPERCARVSRKPPPTCRQRIPSTRERVGEDT